MDGGTYTEDFQRQIAGGSEQSARLVMPQVLRLISPVRSVVDIGCGSGAWLRASGAERKVGIDGPWSKRIFEEMGSGEFISADLSQPIQTNERFDLAISLEVAEHLPHEASETFIATLVGLSDVILFSAAIPGQGGVHHINEQWPDYWWQRFLPHGYVCIDAVRPLIRRMKGVEPWYRQNTLLYARREASRRIGKPCIPEALPITASVGR